MCVSSDLFMEILLGVYIYCRLRESVPRIEWFEGFDGTPERCDLAAMVARNWVSEARASYIYIGALRK